MTPNTSLSYSTQASYIKLWRENMTQVEKFFVGIDIGLDKHQYQISEINNRIISKGQISNTKLDAIKLIKQINLICKKDEIIIGMEATNTYHLNLQNYLISNGFKVIVINPLKTSAYKQIDDFGNKTDPIDANGICQFLIDGKHKKIKQLNNKYLILRELCRCLQKFNSDLTRCRVRLYSRLQIINPEFRQYFSEPLCKSGIYFLDNYMLPDKIKYLDVDLLQEKLDNFANGFGKSDTAKKIINFAKNSFGLTDNIEGYIRYCKYQIEEFKFLQDKVKEIKRELRKECSQDYCKEEIEIISSINGISVEIAAGILSEIGDVNNFDKLSSVIRFAGMIALKKQSGKTDGKSRMSKQGSSYLRNYLYQAVMGTKLHSATYAAVYANKCLKIKDLDSESKRIAKKKIKGNLARRILETTMINLWKKRMFNEKKAFDSIEIEDFIRETISIQFKQKLAKSMCS
jgi:transposase